MWKILSSSLIGEQHITAHKPMQDRFAIAESEDRLILAVADGHGGSYYCRSGEGAAFACDAAVEILKDKTVPWEQAPRRIKELYDRKVEMHLQEAPLTARELTLVNGQPDQIAYGTTLICCAVTPEGIFRAQIGDGEIHALTASGNFLEDLAEDFHCIGFFTTSLASHFAAEQFRWSFDPVPPAAVILYTDGYVSGRTRPRDLLELVKTFPEDGLIPRNVLEAGKRGDDQTVLVAIHADAVSAPAFLEGYARTEAVWVLEDQQAKLTAEIYIADKSIKSYISKLAKCENIRIRNRLIKSLWDRQSRFLSLCEAYQALEEKKENL